MDEQRLELLRAITDWVESESEARRLIARVISLLPDEGDVENLSEVFADESQHSILGESLIRKYSEIAPATDGLASAINILISGATANPSES